MLWDIHKNSEIYRFVLPVVRTDTVSKYCLKFGFLFA